MSIIKTLLIIIALCVCISSVYNDGEVHRNSTLAMTAVKQRDEDAARSRVIPRIERREIERTDCVPTRETFLECLGRMVREENEIIESHRARLLDIIAFRQVLSLTLLEDVMWLEDMKTHYGVKDEAELLRRVDVIPVEMAIAQSLIESGWGTSYAARVGKGLFGQIQSRGSHSVTVPWTPGPDRPQPFSSHRESVTAYFMNLNTHPAYAGFRIAREQTKDPIKLMNHMQRYSIRGNDYIRQVQGIILSLQKGEYK